jgi:hypothetical protein
MTVTAIALSQLVSAPRSLSGVVTLTGAPDVFPYILNFIINDKNNSEVEGEPFISVSISIADADEAAASIPFTLPNLTDGREYSVASYDDNGLISAAVTGVPASAPAKPVLTVLKTDQTSVTLQIAYGDFKGSNCVAYPLFYKRAAASEFLTFELSAYAYNLNNNLREITINNLVSNKLYEFALRTKNSAGLSALSDTVIAFPTDVIDAAPKPTLTATTPSSNKMAAVQSTVVLPTDANTFVEPRSGNFPLVPKFRIVSELLRNGVQVATQDHEMYTPFSSGNTHGSALAINPVIFQIDSYDDTSASYTVRARSVMKSQHNPNGVVDQVSPVSDAVVVAGDRGMSSPSALAALKASMSVITSGDKNVLTVIPYFLPSTTSFTQGLQSLSHEIRIMEETNDLINTQLVAGSDAAQTFTVVESATAPTTGGKTFDITRVADMSKSVKLQIRSKYTVNGTQVATRWRSAAVAPKSLSSQMDAITDLQVLNSDKDGVSSFQITWGAVTDLQKRGLIFRDVDLFVKLTSVSAASAWQKYPESVSSTIELPIYRNKLPNGTDFLKGTSYDFKLAANGSLTATSALQKGLESDSVTAILRPNSFKELDNLITVINGDTTSTITLPDDINSIVDWVEDDLSEFYIAPSLRAGISLTYSITKNGVLQTTTFEGGDYDFTGLTNGQNVIVKITAKFTNDGADTYSEEYRTTLKSEGAPVLSAGVMYNKYISNGQISEWVASTVTPQPSGTKVQTKFEATLDQKGRAVNSYVAVFIPETVGASIPSAQFLKQGIDVENVVINNGTKLSLVSSFVAKACIAYVSNPNGSSSLLIPANATI